MSKKIRLIILIVCVVLFFSMTPVIIGYSLGYRIDLEQKKLVATGGIYLRVWPSPAEVLIDSKSVAQTSGISNSVFTQNLLPKNHIVLVKKDGYFDYQKTLEVKEKEVTKLEHITLFKKNIAFQALVEKTQSPFEKKQQFAIKTGNLYDNSLTKPVLVAKNVIAFDTFQNNLYWVSKDGAFYKSDFTGKTPEKIFESFYSPVTSIKISPDHSRVLYCNDYEILYSYLNDKTFNKVFLNRFSEKISDCFWLNNDYVVFTLNGKIKISEIDTNNEINIIEVQVDAKNPKIYFSQQDKKLYIQTGTSTLVSEQLTQ